MTAFPHLFEPYHLHDSLHLSNRIVMAPMTRSQSPQHTPTIAMAEYYARRARHGVGLIITEGVGTGHEHDLGVDTIPRLQGALALAGWQRVVDAVHDEGGKIMPQLWHLGGANPYGVAPSAVIHPTVTGTDTPPKPLSQSDIEAVIESYVIAARNAKQLGFDGIEIHGAHGYLIDQFFWSHTNQRDDEYGGSTIAERSRFAVELIQAVRTEVGHDYPIVFRFSQWKVGDYSASIADNPEALALWLMPLSDAGVDIFHASTRRFYQPAFAGSDLNLAGWAKKITGKPSITVGSVGLDTAFKDEQRDAAIESVGLDEVERRLAQGEFDLVAVGRALIANPNWAELVRNNAIDSISGYHEAMRHQPVY